MKANSLIQKDRKEEMADGVGVPLANRLNGFHRLTPLDRQTDPSTLFGVSSTRLDSLSSELLDLASTVRRIGNGRGATPESILIAKHEAADRIADLARRLVGAA